MTGRSSTKAEIRRSRIQTRIIAATMKPYTKRGGIFTESPLTDSMSYIRANAAANEGTLFPEKGCPEQREMPPQNALIMFEFAKGFVVGGFEDRALIKKDRDSFEIYWGVKEGKKYCFNISNMRSPAAYCFFANILDGVTLHEMVQNLAVTPKKMDIKFLGNTVISRQPLVYMEVYRDKDLENERISSQKRCKQNQKYPLLASVHLRSFPRAVLMVDGRDNEGSERDKKMKESQRLIAFEIPSRNVEASNLKGVFEIAMTKVDSAEICPSGGLQPRPFISYLRFGGGRWGLSRDGWDSIQTGGGLCPVSGCVCTGGMGLMYKPGSWLEFLVLMVWAGQLRLQETRYLPTSDVCISIHPEDRKYKKGMTHTGQILQLARYMANLTSTAGHAFMLVSLPFGERVPVNLQPLSRFPGRWRFFGREATYETRHGSQLHIRLTTVQPEGPTKTRLLHVPPNSSHKLGHGGSCQMVWDGGFRGHSRLTGGGVQAFVGALLGRSSASELNSQGLLTPVTRHRPGIQRIWPGRLCLWQRPKTSHYHGFDSPILLPGAPCLSTSFKATIRSIRPIKHELDAVLLWIDQVLTFLQEELQQSWTVPSHSSGELYIYFLTFMDKTYGDEERDLCTFMFFQGRRHARTSIYSRLQPHPSEDSNVLVQAGISRTQSRITTPLSVMGVCLQCAKKYTLRRRCDWEQDVRETEEWIGFSNVEDGNAQPPSEKRAAGNLALEEAKQAADDRWAKSLHHAEETKTGTETLMTMGTFTRRIGLG
ncbi:hypothetical protein BDN72DRAFT_928272 [Pluteus cervinus]|uniref:Uncharacterized protein n=1 Tax=Pluteus cervinus TaxID=181527 RepID=A0ACD3AC76_9AGAR|nr:hypothetical protein BDN72DRAFT_928272 [Pluteus cervinus]